MASRSRRIERVIGKASQRLHQGQNPNGESKDQNGRYGDWIRGMAGAAGGPDRPRKPRR